MMALALVDFFDLRYDRQHKSPVLFLKDVDTEQFLPVWIGDLEARSIEDAYYQRTLERPLTHDLLVTLLGHVSLNLDKVVIDRLDKGTYFASLYMEQSGKTVEVDCRPSDAIAIALRMDAQIFVEESLMYKIKFVELREGGAEGEMEMLFEEPKGTSEDDRATFQSFLQNISPSDFQDG